MALFGVKRMPSPGVGGALESTFHRVSFLRSAEEYWSKSIFDIVATLGYNEDFVTQQTEQIESGTQRVRDLMCKVQLQLYMDPWDIHPK